MKKISFLLVLGMIYMSANSQTIFTDFIDFETNNGQYFSIDSSQTFNIWQIGKPQKTFLNSSYSSPNGIITDTLNDYPVNNISSFQIQVHPSAGNCWGMGMMYFYHKYDFEQKKDGGYIEVKYDYDTTWTNIIFDTDPQVGTYASNMYTSKDTIKGHIPAFTGTSNGWVRSEFNWRWQIGVKKPFHDFLSIRFTMKSDSNNTNQEGWLIDNIYLKLDYCTSSINSISQKNNNTFIYPNPVNNISTLVFPNKQDVLTTIRIFDNIGREIKSMETYDSKVMIDKNVFSEGIYYYQITQNETIVGQDEFIVLK